MDTTEENLNELSLSMNTRQLKEFKLHQRALHVFQEAWRVREFCRCCQRQDGLSALGNLMKQSHASLRDLYECSHPELDRLVSAGAEFVEGARLTGAGWGGCAVALTSADRVDDYVASLKHEFYPAGKLLEHLVFATEPQNGAMVLLENQD
ncbi:UNVERIFIED_CONTAM: hypothetical protein B566_EDAN017902 [Ephemera danica]|nr:hypothetical protein B566_EDAN017902 [Ephemera danica]